MGAAAEATALSGSAGARAHARSERFESGPKAWAHGLYENASRLSAEDRAFVRKLYALDSQLHALLCGAPPSGTCASSTMTGTLSGRALRILAASALRALSARLVRKIDGTSDDMKCAGRDT